MGTEHRGFASMDKDVQREIASMGGKAAHRKGTAHKWTSEEARLAGQKGGGSSRSLRGRRRGVGHDKRWKAKQGFTSLGESLAVSQSRKGLYRTKARPAPALWGRLFTFVSGRQGLKVWCPYCEKEHVHGFGYGHRGAHCTSTYGFSRTGYYVIAAPTGATLEQIKAINEGVWQKEHERNISEALDSLVADGKIERAIIDGTEMYRLTPVAGRAL